MRSLACLTGLGFLAAFYMAVSMRSASSSSSKREVSLFGRYEKLKLTSENDALKEKIRALTAKLEAGDAKAMQSSAAAAAAASAAATVPPASAESSPPSLQATLTAALKPAATADSSSVAQKFGDRRDYRLTKELIRSRCNAQNIILVTFVNSKRADYGYTWAGHVKRLNLTNYLVGAMDGDALTKLVCTHTLAPAPAASQPAASQPASHTSPHLSHLSPHLSSHPTPLLPP